MGIDKEVRVGAIQLANPVLPASGTFGYGTELLKYYEVRSLGGLVTKAITPEPRKGNPMPRIAEATAGMLNAVGLENPGIDAFERVLLPQLKRLRLPIIVNLAGRSEVDYVSMAERLNEREVAAFELNLSCPNVKAGCMSIGTDPHEIERVVGAVRRVTDKALWVKLTPNVTDIVEMARAAEAAGADAVSLINTLLGMVIDLRTRRPILKNNTGGFSGPAVMPVAIRMVSQCYRALDIPIVGMGGIASAEDAIAFMMAGASAVQVGSTVLTDPDTFFALPDDMAVLAETLGFESLAEVTGSLQYWE